MTSPTLPSFEEMLDTVYNDLGPDIKSKLKLPQPELVATTTNTYWKNVKQFLQTIDRDPIHFINYLKNELGEVNWVSSSKSDGIVIIGKIKKDKIMNLIQQYMIKYVVCNFCKNSNSSIIFNNSIKKYNFTCKHCMAQYNV